MSINNYVWDLRVRIDNIITDCELNTNVTEDDKKVLRHAYRLRENLEVLNKKIRIRIMSATDQDVNQIKADINSLLDVVKSTKINNAKKIHLLEYGVETLIENYDEISQQNNDGLEKKIKAAKEKRDAARREEQELLKDINSKIERMKKEKVLKKSIEEQDIKERTDRISGVIEKVKVKKDEQKKSNEFVEDTSYLSVAEDNQQSKKIKEDIQIAEVSQDNKLQDESKKSLSIFQRIKNKINSIRAGKSNREKEEKNRKKRPWIVAVPLAGLFAFSIGAQAVKNSHNPKDSNEKNLGDESSSHSDDEKIQIITATEKYDVEFEDNTQATTKQNKEIQTTTRNEDNKIVNDDSIDLTNVPNSSNENIKIEIPDEVVPEEVVVNIGDKVIISDGVNYTQTCYGEGSVGVIGEFSWRPSTEYFIERAAFFHDGKFLGLTNDRTKNINSDLKKYAQEHGVDETDIDMKVLISLVPGSYDTGWASVSLGEMQENIVKQEQNLGKSNNKNRQEIVDQER